MFVDVIVFPISLQVTTIYKATESLYGLTGEHTFHILLLIYQFEMIK